MLGGDDDGGVDGDDGGGDDDDMLLVRLLPLLKWRLYHVLLDVLAPQGAQDKWPITEGDDDKASEASFPWGRSWLPREARTKSSSC